MSKIESYNVLDRRGTLLHFAAVLANPELFEMILKLKLDVNAVLYSNGETALKILVDNYIPDYSDYSLYQWAKDASYKCIKFMLGYTERLGIDVNKICKY